MYHVFQLNEIKRHWDKKLVEVVEALGIEIM